MYVNMIPQVIENAPLVHHQLTAGVIPAVSSVNHVRKATKEVMNSITTYGHRALRHLGQTLITYTLA